MRLRQRRAETRSSTKVYRVPSRSIGAYTVRDRHTEQPFPGPILSGEVAPNPAVQMPAIEPQGSIPLEPFLSVSSSEPIGKRSFATAWNDCAPEASHSGRASRYTRKGGRTKRARHGGSLIRLMAKKSASAPGARLHVHPRPAPARPRCRTGAMQRSDDGVDASGSCGFSSAPDWREPDHLGF